MSFLGNFQKVVITVEVCHNKLSLHAPLLYIFPPSFSFKWCDCPSIFGGYPITLLYYVLVFSSWPNLLGHFSLSKSLYTFFATLTIIHIFINLIIHSVHGYSIYWRK